MAKPICRLWCVRLKEELDIDLIPEIIRLFGTYITQADGKPAGTMVKMTTYTADYKGTLKPFGEIEELAWVDSSDKYRVSRIQIEKIFPDLLNKGLIG